MARPNGLPVAGLATRTRLSALWAAALRLGRPVHEEVRPVGAAIGSAERELQGTVRSHSGRAGSQVGRSGGSLSFESPRSGWCYAALSCVVSRSGS